MHASLFVLTTMLPALALGGALPPAKRATPPTQGSVRIHPQNDGSKCLQLQDDTPTNDAPVNIATCSDSSKQRWTAPHADGPQGTIELLGTGYCLDAGSPQDGSNPLAWATAQMKVYQCNPSYAQQTWVYTNNGDNHFALWNQNNYCLGATDGGLNNAQITGCGYDNQQWTMD